MSAVDLASGTRGRPGRMWALNFARPLTVGEVGAAIARVRGLTKRPIYEIGTTSRRYFQAGPTQETPLPVLPRYSVGRVAAWTADQARTCGVKAASTWSRLSVHSTFCRFGPPRLAALAAVA